ncbi:sigma-54-dependent Fis family transcriptional regulator [Halalkalibacter okhensis]|uniref:sigma-54-dependent Fis family transcriptional regulator n=1 Tax=Halalkalibacter okhensis TaxID=333138 RepID=UPI0006898E89|nr:sigma-54-dependent Fis family transcriptional regulator [Halalkalibacter okhensis]
MENSTDQLSVIDEADLLSELQVLHWMVPPHFVVYENHSIRDMLELMQHKNIDLIVINQDHEIVGIMTQQMMNRLYANGISIERQIDIDWLETPPTITPDASILQISLTQKVVPVVNQNQKLVGSISLREVLMAKEFLISSIQHNVNVIDIILDIAYEGVVLVDRNGFVVKLNQAYRNFLGILSDEVIGKHVTEVIDNTELHITAKTGVPQRGKVQVIQGQKMIVHRIPIWQNNELVGAIGMLIFEGVSELYRILEHATQTTKDHPSSLTASKETRKAELSSMNTFDRILGVSDEMYACKRLSKKAAKTNATVLITGETGTGKEIFAQAIHQSSGRSEGPFVAINCAAIPENLLESELFGYVEGAFTGAKKSGSQGKFELANGGTIFLDEIGDMPKHMQTKILRVLEERKVMKVGGSEEIPINVRVIAATHHTLHEKVKEGAFREDLYYRLNVIELEIPSLRRRRADIPILFSHYLKQFSKENNVEVKKVDPKAMELLMSYDWPGNIRQLLNTAEQLVTLVDGEVIKPIDLPSIIKDQQRNINVPPLKLERSEKEKLLIEQILEEVGGNKTEAAKRLGIHRTTLHKKLKQYNVK